MPLIRNATEIETQFLVSSLLHPATGINTIVKAVRIEGTVDETRLFAAWQQLVQLWQPLRTRLERSTDGTVTVVEGPVEGAALEIFEASSQPEVLERLAEATRRGLSASERPWKAQLIRHSETRRTLLWAVHRALLDEPSVAALAADLGRLYEQKPIDAPGVPESKLAPLDPTADQAKDYVASLSGAPTVWEFPLKSARPRLLEVTTRALDRPWEPQLWSEITSHASRQGLDPMAYVSAVAASALCQFTHQESLLLGYPVRTEGTNAVGALTASLPVSFVDTPGFSFTQSLVRWKSTLALAQAAGRLGFRAITTALGLKMDPSVNPVFQVAIEGVLPFQPQFSGCTVTELSLAPSAQQLDLFVQVGSTGLRVCFAEAVVAPEVALAFAETLEVLLRAVVQKPERPMSEHELIPVTRRATLLEGPNATGQPEYLEKDLYALVSHHFERQAEKIALMCGAQSVSYGQLAQKVASLSAQLERSKKPGQDLIGISLPRSTDMVVAMLAALRSGLAFVPLDPSFPSDRIDYMVKHSRMGTVVTNDALASRFSASGVDVLQVGQGSTSAEPVRAISPESPAYVIYTSGSTGNPKGVSVPRRALSNFLSSMVKEPGISESDRWCAVTTLSFDIAELELLGPLVAGATVIIATEEETKDPRRLSDLLRSSGATILQATPVTWQLLCSSGWTGDRSLKALCGGEALSASLAQTLHPRVASLWNMYGPTETTVWSTLKKVSDPAALITVGHPIANTTVYILDEHGRPLPTGVEGSLYLGGSGVTLGYLHDADLTNKKFVTDPFRGQGLMYDTGDRAKLTTSGEVIVVGRNDFQVKLRGFRIELGEIEARLASFAGIQQAVAIVRRDDPNNPELVAYYTQDSGLAEPSVAQLRQHCSGSLPPYMIPSYFKRLEAFPLTPNGKVDRKALPRPVGTAAATSSQTPATPRSDVERSVSEAFCQVLGAASVGLHENFFELGGTSVTAFSLAVELGKRFSMDFSVLKVFEHASVAALAHYLHGAKNETSILKEAQKRAQARRRGAGPKAFDVAIVGAAGRFPGAQDLEQLWEVLREGRNTVTVFNREDLDPLVPSRDRNDPAYLPSRGVLPDVDMFDGAFFGIPPNEAELMDPQQRVFLEVCWEAFENAGYVGETIDGSVGVWAAKGNDFYYVYNVLTRPDKLAIMGDIAAEIANEKDHIAPRVSHKLNLTGPSLSVHAACSSTLVVIENAYQALITYQVDVALAGGVDIRTPQKSGQRFEEGGIFSDDGLCRPFDARATGTMFGEGAGAVVLKRLEDAQRDNDTILAVIKGAAVNHDGGHKVSYLAPSVEGQARVIAQALAIGDVDPDTISFVEAHGTGTPIGDPIEVEALTRVFRASTSRRQFCAIGSIKGNFGHATTAAGIAGLFKVILSMKNRQIPSTVNFSVPNPQIDFASSPFFVNTKLNDWKPQGATLRAGVSSFGFCGTNAHVVLEEAPARGPSGKPGRPVELILLSAKHPKALDELAAKTGKALATLSAPDLADAAFTSHVGRKRFEHRRVAVLRSASEAPTLLAQPSGGSSFSIKTDSESPALAFVFPGQGSQYINMGLSLYGGESVFRDTVDRCAQILLPHLGCDLRDFLFPAAEDAEKATQSLNNTFYTQPAIFTISYSLAQLMMSWGQNPEAFVGHSIGEFVAATLSGVMALEDALKLVAARGRLMQSLPAGSMLSVRLGEDSLKAKLPQGIDMAAVNSPKLCVVAGPTPAIQAFAAQLEAEGVVCRLLHTSHAFHSSMMDPVVDEFQRIVQSVPLSPPSIPFVSTVTGDWITAEGATDPAYWARHLRSPVQFSRAIQELLKDPRRAVLECGPRRTGATLALQHQPENPGRIVATMPDSADPADEYTSIMLALGSLWANGCDIDWSAVHSGEQRRRVALPTYPFQRRRYWIEPGDVSSFGFESNGFAPAAALRAELEEPTHVEEGQDRWMLRLVSLMEEALGEKFDAFSEHSRFIELGLDSLLTTQLARMVRQKMGFEVTFRQLSEAYSTPRLLVDAIRASQPADEVAHDSSATAVKASTASKAAPAVRNLTGARLGRDPQGKAAWYVPDPTRPGQFQKVDTHE